MKRYILNFKRLLILFAIVPLFIGNSALSIISISSSVRSTVENLKDELKLAAMGLKEYYDYDLVNNNDLVDGFLEYDTDYLDKMAATGIDFTIFKGNQRFMTTIKDENGKRIEGTFADDDLGGYRGKDVPSHGYDHFLCHPRRLYSLAYICPDDVGCILEAENHQQGHAAFGARHDVTQCAYDGPAAIMVSASGG